MKIALAVVLLLGSACDSITDPTNQEVPAPAGAEEATTIVLAEWSVRLETRQSHLADLPPIRWFEGACLSYPDRPPGACTMGYYQYTAFGDQEIHLAVEYPTIHDGALAHELLHWELDDTRSDSDGDHAQPIWADVAAVNDALALSGF